MRLLIWHVHGSWTTAFVQGPHEYLVPVVPGRGEWGRGRARTWDWPSSVREVPAEALRSMGIDAVVLQRPEEIRLVEEWAGRRPGYDLPAVYLEHNTPGGAASSTRHPIADRDDLPGVPLVHVTHFNQLMWDTGALRTHVIEHGVPDPGERYRPDRLHAGVVVNEPLRRGRAVGADLVPRFAGVVPLEVFGMAVGGLADLCPPGRVRAHEDLPQPELHRALARCGVYLHPHRWTSLGLSLIEAMTMGMPVVGLATTEAADVLPAEVAVLSNDLDVLDAALSRLIADPDSATALGARGREFALRRFGLGRFLDDWDRLLVEVIRTFRPVATVRR